MLIGPPATTPIPTDACSSDCSARPRCPSSCGAWGPRGRSKRSRTSPCRWPAIDYAHTSFTADDEGLVIRRGVIWRHVVSVPRSRVQHTDVSQGPLERRYDLGTVVIYTAGNEHAQVTLRGVEYATALAIRDLLLPQHRHDVV